MILFNRLLMVNWMYYGIEEVIFKNSNLLTGITGSGKSAMIDAMQIILMGDASGRYFNKSAGKGAKRTIRTYLKGQYGVNEYKRDKGSFSSYIVGEFFDTVENRYFCGGIMFDLFSDDTCNHDFFEFEGKFDKNWFLNGRVAKSREAIKKFFRTENMLHKVFSSDREYKDWFIHKQGIADDNFFKLFRNAVAYQPIDDIEEFIIHNICQGSKDIDVENMKTSIKEHQNLREELKNFVSKKEDLEKIAEVYNNYLSAHKQRREQQYFIDRSEVDKLSERIEILREEIDKIACEKCDLFVEQEQVEEDIKRLSDRYMEIITEMARDPDKKHKEDLENEINNIEAEIKQLSNNGENCYNSFMQRVAAWKKHIKAMIENNLLDGMDADIHILDNYLSDCSKYKTDNFSRLSIEGLIDNNKKLDNLRQEILRRYLHKQTELADYESGRNECTEKIRNLERGQKKYRKELEDFKWHIEKELHKIIGKNVNVNFLADVIDITDSKWVDVIEGYMSRQKSYLLVEPEYYTKAYSIFKKYKKENNVDGIGIIDGEKVYNDEITVKPNSLSWIVTSDNKYAKAYVDYLLGNVIMVEDISDMRKYRTSVMSDGILYKGYVMSAISPKLMKNHLIGRNSIKYQLEEAKRELSYINQQISEIEKYLTNVEDIKNEEIFNNDYIEKIANIIGGLKKIPSMKKECDKKYIELTAIDTSYTDKLDAEGKQIANDIKEMNSRNESLLKNIGALEKSFEEKNDECNVTEDSYEENKSKFEQGYENVPVSEETINNYNNALQNKKSADAVNRYYISKVESVIESINANIGKFKDKINAFNMSYSDSVLSTDIHSDEWKKEYNRISAISIGDYEDAAKAAEGRAKEMFENEFINKIKENIDIARNEIHYLNKALSEYKFGRTRYRFKCSPTDNAELRKYYDMIMDGRLDGRSLFNADVYEQYDPLINEMFRMISLDADDNISREEIEQNIDKYKSFQTYLKFDIVEIDENGNEQPLSSVIGGRSGGERQTPFYIAILASLMKVYNINDDTINSLRLVIFDEAFDKIDTSRIEEFISMLKQVGFQAIVAAPDNKSPYIAPLVENTLVVLKPNATTSRIGGFGKEQNG